MDPTLTPMSRLKLVNPEYGLLTQNVRGDEDPPELNLFVDHVVGFSQTHPRGFTRTSQQAEWTLELVRLFAGLKLERDSRRVRRRS